MAHDQNVADEESSLKNSGTLYPYVQDQGELPVCYTFSTTESLGAIYARETSKPPIELSPQQLIDHVPIVYNYPEKRKSTKGDGCYLGSHVDCLTYAMHHPLCLVNDYPLRTSRNEDGILDPIPNKNKRYLVGNYHQPDVNAEQEINDTLKYQPIVGAIRFFPSFGSFRGQGVYMGCLANEKDTVGHSILIIGYGIKNGIKYYLIKNSYGEKWGDKGYGKIKRELIYNLAYPTSVYEDPSDFKK